MVSGMLNGQTLNTWITLRNDCSGKVMRNIDGESVDSWNVPRERGDKRTDTISCEAFDACSCRNNTVPTGKVKPTKVTDSYNVNTSNPTSNTSGSI